MTFKVPGCNVAAALATSSTSGSDVGCLERGVAERRESLVTEPIDEGDDEDGDEERLDEIVDGEDGDSSCGL